MITIEHAIRLVDRQILCQDVEILPTIKALGMVLAQDIASDIDSPPYDKAMMDGYAIRAEDLTGAEATWLHVVEQVTAGMTPTKTLAAGEATRITTGAPIPDGATAVVIRERTEETRDRPDQVAVKQEAIAPGKNILRQGTSMREGRVVIKAGTILRPTDIGILAEVGQTHVPVFTRPRVAVLSTGDEIVEASMRPAAGQIRNSNGPMLEAMAKAVGAKVTNLGIARDNKEDLTAKILEGLTFDVLLLSGGVSAGMLDLVPSVLAEHGVSEIFHKINMKPGKPLWFGVQEAAVRTLVFGLPGNPVSSLVGFHVFARRVIERMQGRSTETLEFRQVPLAEPMEHHGDRPVFFPSRHEHQGGGSIVRTLDWKGSADLATLAHANAFVLFQPREATYEAGELVPVIELD